MEVSKTECKRILRTLELKAYRNVVDALRAQGTLTSSKHEVLKNLAAALKVSDERYRSEIRRAVNDDLLNTIAQCTNGVNTETEWRAESVKRVPLTPMVASQTAFTVLADTISDLVVLENRRLSTSGVESNNVIDTYKTRIEKNSTNYKTSKILESLLQKRKNHHQEAIISEIEKIKLSNRYPHSNKSDYQEISHTNENSDLSTTENYSQKTVSWRPNNEVYSIEITERSDLITNGNSIQEQTRSEKFSERLEIISDPCPQNIRSKLKTKTEPASKSIRDGQLFSNLSQLQSSSNSKNLRLQPIKKYSYNSVEISSFENESATDDKSMLNIVRNKPVNTTKSAMKTLDTSVGSHIEISYNDKTTKNVAKGRKSKRRGKARTKRSSKIVKVRKLNAVQRVKSDPVKEAPARISRISMRNARRRNYARMASGDYDISELRSMKKENKVNSDDQENEQNKTTDVEDHSDNSNAPIEVSYNNPTAPKSSSNYELDTTVTHFPEDDMRPHTFNLIPASRRLKMLKKRAKSPIAEEMPAKKADLSSKNEQNATIGKSKLNDINALRKVLAAHENIENMATCDIGDLPQIIEELLDIPDRSTGELVEIKEDLINKKVPPVGLSNVKEKKPPKPKSKISEISSIENLHSILAKVKDSEKLKKDSLNIEKNQIKNDISYKNSLTNTVPKEPNRAFIEIDNLEQCSSNTSFSEEEENYEDVSSGLSEFEEDENMEKQELVKTSNELDSEVKSPTNEDIVSITVDEVEEHIESDFSEQLIDIESADVIISDNLSGNDSSVVTVEDEMKTSKSEREIDQTLVSSNNEPPNERMRDVIVINVDKDETSNANDSNSADVNEDVQLSPTKSKVVNTSDFRYVADIDDPCVQMKSEPPKLQTLPKTTIVITKSLPSSSVNSTPLATKIINIKPNTLIKLETSALVNSVQNNKIKEICMNDNARNVKKPFVLLETMSTTNSKSLLKSISLQKTVNDKVTSNVDYTIKNPKKLAIYSSLKNINLATFSSISQNTSNRTNVTNILKAEDLPNVEIRTPKSNPLISFKSIRSTEQEPKRIVLSQTLGKNLRLVDVATKDKINISDVVSSEKFFEISSNSNSKTNS